LVACLQRVQTAVDLGIGHIILETDAQEVVRAMNSTAYDDSVVGHLVEEIKFLSRSNFISFECVHVPRNCNKAAQVLAAVGVGSTEGEEHLSCNTSDCVNVIVVDDLSTRVQ